jgi:hypothetical protein
MVISGKTHPGLVCIGLIASIPSSAPTLHGLQPLQQTRPHSSSSPPRCPRISPAKRRGRTTPAPRHLRSRRSHPGRFPALALAGDRDRATAHRRWLHRHPDLPPGGAHRRPLHLRPAQRAAPPTFRAALPAVQPFRAKPTTGGGLRGHRHHADVDRPWPEQPLSQGHALRLGPARADRTHPPTPHPPTGSPAARRPTDRPGGIQPRPSPYAGAGLPHPLPRSCRSVLVHRLRHPRR